MIKINQIYEMKIRHGIITDVSVVIGNTQKYNNLKGYVPPCTSYNIGAFCGAEAISRILCDIGVGPIELNLQKAKLGSYAYLSKYFSDETRVEIECGKFNGSRGIWNNIKEVILNTDETIKSVSLKAFSNEDVITISYKAFLLICDIWGENEIESEIILHLKKHCNVVTFDGQKYDYYESMATETTKIIRHVHTSGGFHANGVFEVDITKPLLEFKVLEKSLSSKGEMPKGTSFYIASNQIDNMD